MGLAASLQYAYLTSLSSMSLFGALISLNWSLNLVSTAMSLYSKWKIASVCTVWVEQWDFYAIFVPDKWRSSTISNTLMWGLSDIRDEEEERTSRISNLSRVLLANPLSGRNMLFVYAMSCLSRYSDTMLHNNYCRKYLTWATSSSNFEDEALPIPPWGDFSSF